MKLWLILALLLAGGATAWVLSTRSAPTFVPETEAPKTFAPAPTVLITEPTSDEAERVLDVEGMCCDGCTGKLHAILTELPGVRNAAVDFETGTARAIVSAELDPALLEQALTVDKYSARLRVD